MLSVESAALALGLRGVDVRHEQAAAMAAHAYARLLNRPGVCMAASGPGTTNLITGIAHAFVDCTPVVALGGSSPASQSHKGTFQEIDQLAMLAPCTKWSDRVHRPERIPELLGYAIREAMSGKPGPVYLDLPGDVLFAEVDEEKVAWPEPWDPDRRPRPAAGPAEIRSLTDLIAGAERPVVVSGMGVLWSGAEAELRTFVEAAGIPFFTTPQGRGVIPEDHELCYPAARSTAFREADLILVVGTRMNYVIGHASPPRFAATAKVARIDISAEEIATSPRRLDVGVVADARTALTQLTDAVRDRVVPDGFTAWRDRLRELNGSKLAEHERELADDAVPIHPLRLCRELRDFMDRETILCVDGQEILNYGRQVIPTYRARHRLNSGTFGTMGVGLPFGLGAKVACPDKPVIVLHGDGSFGMNAMEIDTAVRHDLPILVVISLNGGWTGDPAKERPGRELGYTRFDKMAEAFGAYGEYVERPDDIRPALDRAMAAVVSGQPALVNVVTDWRARATTAAFTEYVT
ncbi:thiamine pyrophosphate-dependent acetolactate synthase large subunit-like protein [Streptosporangium lutulentum]|uniref:Thiamine pyrophosphate-dependent acetolactate synthase large subunit-like protein n=2 Tax=Streptosporangium lutulentum TaxID=1461250 RepID=A0ABT9Q7N7_9ACTN|nr:thiamine pyrophosphate-dependent acetolactate synthase large subunit-like protein [Streptosporangium lutulentum]